VAKDPGSPYRAGRTLNWLKLEQTAYRIEERGWKGRATAVLPLSVAATLGAKS
jgi:ATP-dependent DNA ligase